MWLSGHRERVIAYGMDEDFSKLSRVEVRLAAGPAVLLLMEGYNAGMFMVRSFLASVNCIVLSVRVLVNDVLSYSDAIQAATS